MASSPDDLPLNAVKCDAVADDGFSIIRRGFAMVE